MKKLMVAGLWLLVGCETLPAATPEACTGAEACGTAADCYALCANVERLQCAEKWHIDHDDGACLDLCLNASPGLCPALGAVQRSCEAIERVSECEK